MQQCVGLISGLVLALLTITGVSSAPDCVNERPGALKAIKLKAPSAAIKATWQGPSNRACVDRYLVIVRPTSGDTTVPYQLLTTSKLQKTIINLRPKTKYRVDVVPVSKSYGQGPIATAVVTTGKGPKCNASKLPGTPVKAIGRAVASRSDRVKLFWSAPTVNPSACISGYKIEGFASSGERVYTNTLTSEVRRTTISGMKANAKYRFYMTALSAKGSSNPVSVEVTTQAAAPPPPAPAVAAAPVPASRPAAVPAAAPVSAPAASYNAANCRTDGEPAAPMDLTATANGGNKISITWGSGDPNICTHHFKLDGYVLKTGDRVLDVDTEYNSYTATMLSPGVEYVFTLAAVNNKGDSVPDTVYAVT